MDLRNEYQELSGHRALVHIPEGSYRPEGDVFFIGYVEWLERQLVAARQIIRESPRLEAEEKKFTSTNKQSTLLKEPCPDCRRLIRIDSMDSCIYCGSKF